jgi:hypothetical protein
MICPPEYIIYQPEQSNNWNYVIEVFDPVSSGTYSSCKLDCCLYNLKDKIKRKIESMMSNAYASVGLNYFEDI